MPRLLLEKLSVRTKLAMSVGIPVLGGAAICSLPNLSLDLGLWPSAAVLGVSGILGGLIARELARSILSLSEAVRTRRDFDQPVKKTSSDELGAVTDAFNEMLVEVVGRDIELEQHRSNLEEIVNARTHELQLVLDNVDQGLVMVRADGTLRTQRSSALDRIVGVSPTTENTENTFFGDVIAAQNPITKKELRLGWELLTEDIFPVEVAIDQLPKEMTLPDGRHLTFDFKAMFRDTDSGPVFDGALVVVSDVTKAVKANAEQNAQREYIAAFESVVQDPEGFLAFASEMEALLARLSLNDLTDCAMAMRIVHTIKGNAAQWGMSSVAKLAHALETRMIDENSPPTEDERTALQTAWQTINDRLRPLLASAGNPEQDRLDITPTEIDSIANMAGMETTPREDIARLLQRLKHERVRARFFRLEDQARRLAIKLSKPRPKVVIDDGDVRLPRARFAAFWAATIHAVRNMMDHGIESAEERLLAGKSREGTITLFAHATNESVVLTLSDDGRGIDLEAIREKAKAAGLPTETEADLHRAIFSPGISTKENPNEISGRGVGLSALLEECSALGGTLRIHTQPQKGTRLTFELPLSPPPPTKRLTLAPRKAA